MWLRSEFNLYTRAGEQHRQGSSFAVGEVWYADIKKPHYGFTRVAQLFLFFNDKMLQDNLRWLNSGLSY